MAEDASLWNRAEEQLRVFAAAIAAGAFALQASGYLSLRFQIRALGIEPELSVFNEEVLFEGAYLLVFLLINVPLVLILLGLVALPVLGLRQIGSVRRVLGRWSVSLRESPRALTILACAWGIGSVQFVLREIMRFNELIFFGVPCEPDWLRGLTLIQDDAVLSLHLFFALLMLFPLPMIWVVGKLWDAKGWRGAAAVVAALALVQTLLIPIHFGVLLRASEMPRLAGLPEGEDPDATPGDKIWEIYRTADVIHYLVRPANQPTVNRIVEVEKQQGGARSVEVLGIDRFYQVLAEGQQCD